MWLHLDRVSSAHERVMSRRQRADGALGRQLDQPVERKHNVPVLLEAGPVEIYRDVAGQQLSRPCRGGDRPVSGSRPRKGLSPGTTSPAEETIPTRRRDSGGPETKGRVSKTGHSSSARRLACAGGRSVNRVTKFSDK